MPSVAPSVPVHLSLLGNWEPALPLLATLVQAGYQVTWSPPDAVATISGDLFLARLDGPALSPTWLAQFSPCIVWNVHDDPALTLAAYASNVTLVLPGATSPALLVQSIQQVLARVAQPLHRGPAPKSCYSTLHRGEQVRLLPDTVIEIIEGVLAQVVIHPDGAEVLLGLLGPGQLLAPHPEDNCFIQLSAHTDVTLCLQPWSSISQPDFANRLRTRLWHMEAWAAMQARPNLEDRLLGILSLLAEQFGQPQADGCLIDVRITHTQLATAIGANRTTITRLLSQMRHRNILTTSGHGHDERFCLLTWQPSHHDPRKPVAFATPHPVRITTRSLSD